MVVWIRRDGTIAWSPRSPDSTPLEFSVWGYVKDRVFVVPLPASLEELRVRITEAVATMMRTCFIGFGTKSLTDGTSAA